MPKSLKISLAILIFGLLSSTLFFLAGIWKVDGIYDFTYPLVFLISATTTKSRFFLAVATFLCRVLFCLGVSAALLKMLNLAQILNLPIDFGSYLTNKNGLGIQLFLGIFCSSFYLISAQLLARDEVKRYLGNLNFLFKARPLSFLVTDKKLGWIVGGIVAIILTSIALRSDLRANRYKAAHENLVNHISNTDSNFDKNSKWQLIDDYDSYPWKTVWQLKDTSKKWQVIVNFQGRDVVEHIITPLQAESSH